MRYDVGRFRRPMRRGAMEQMVSLISLGDGSTLTLDFTTGVLDPRLTFTRASDATFINSQGFVQYADANHVANSVFSGAGTGNAPTNWSGSVGVNLTIPSAGTRRAETTTAAQNWIGSPAFATQIGITYSTSVLVTSVSGQHYANTVTVTGSPTLVGYYLNGSSVGQFSTASAGLITVVWTATTIGSHAVRIGIGCTGANISNGVCEFTQPRSVPGNFTQPAYFANSSTTAGYYAPRFDHDPTTRVPRGLLVEGQATNLMCWSESFAQSGGTNNWQTRENVTLGTLTTSPDNSTNAYPINETTTSGVHRQTTYFTTGLSGAYSWSIWAKCVDSGTPRRLYINAVTALGVGALFDLTASGDSGTAVNVAGTAGNRAGTWVKYPNGWYRCTVVGTRAADAAMFLQINRSSSSTASDDSFAGSTNNGIIMWGSMLEAGSGASSYIPTGASQGTRNADNCTMNDITALNYSTTNGTMLYVGRFTQINSSSFPTRAGFQQAGGSNPGFEIFTNGSLIFSAARSAAANPERSTTITTNSSIKFATAFDASLASNEVTICLNGGTVLGSSATGLTATYAPTIFALGRAGYELFYPSGTIAQVKYWPTTLPNAQLQSITT